MELKPCKTCGATNSDWFTNRSDGKRRAWCEPCIAEAKRQKPCTSCGTTDPEMFGTRPKSGGSRSKCEDCRLTGMADVLRTAWNNARTRASRKKFDFTITLRDVFTMYRDINGICPITKVALTSTNETEFRSNPWAPSLDRIDSDYGYTRENTRIVCWHFNMAKGQGSDSFAMNFFAHCLRHAPPEIAPKVLPGFC